MKETRRSINTKFWTDPDVEDMSPRATYLFMSLLTFPENNMAGVFEISDRKIAIYTKMESDDVTIALHELTSKKKIMRHGSWIAIRNHVKNQKTNPNMMMSVIKDLCPSPMPIKVWLLSKIGSTETVDWLETAVFSVNSYYQEQKVRIAKSQSNKGKDIAAFKSAMTEIPEIRINKDDLLKILTNPLPFKPEELSKHNSMVTLTKGFNNLLVNMNNEVGSMNNEVGSMNNEVMNGERFCDNTELDCETEMGEIDYPTVFQPYKHQTSQPFENYSPPVKKPEDLLKKVWAHWNSLSGDNGNLPHDPFIPTSFNNAPMMLEVINGHGVDRVIECIDKLNRIYSKLSHKPSSPKSLLVNNSITHWLNSDEKGQTSEKDMEKYDAIMDEVFS